MLKLVHPLLPLPMPLPLLIPPRGIDVQVVQYNGNLSQEALCEIGRGMQKLIGTLRSEH